LSTVDVKLPGLLTAGVAFPPAFGARLISFDAAEALRVPGVTEVVQVPEGIAVVGKGMWAALKGRRALKVQWDESAGVSMNSDTVLAPYRSQGWNPGTPFVRPADGQRTPDTAVKTIQATYEFPFLAHG